MEPKIVQRGATLVAGYVHKTTGGNNTIPAFWGEISADGRLKALHGQDFAASHADYGICFNMVGDDMDYLVGLEVKAGAAVPAGFETLELPCGEYAVFTVPPCGNEEFVPALMNVWQNSEKWLAAAGYARAEEACDFELYKCDCKEDVMCESCETGLMHVDICIRVEKL